MQMVEFQKASIPHHCFFSLVEYKGTERTAPEIAKIART